MSITIIAIMILIMIIVVIVSKCQTYAQEYIQRYGVDGDPSYSRILRDTWLPGLEGQDVGQDVGQDNAGQDATRIRRRRRN